jgi:hypothetical protein
LTIRPPSTARIHCDRKKGRYRLPWDPIAPYWSRLPCGDVCGSERPAGSRHQRKRRQLAFRLPATARRPCWAAAPKPAAAATRALIRYPHRACIRPYSRRQSHRGYDLRKPERHFDHEARFYGQSVESLVCWSRYVCELKLSGACFTQSSPAAQEPAVPSLSLGLWSESPSQGSAGATLRRHLGTEPSFSEAASMHWSSGQRPGFSHPCVPLSRLSRR